jgi:hypothetical protein
MKIFKLACVLGFGAMLSACGASDVVTRDAPLSDQSATNSVSFAANPQDRNVRTISTQSQGARTILPQAILGQINVAKVNVIVPTELKVSEANRYYPNGDIVWREDGMGNRHAQVAKIVHDAMVVGTSTFTGPVPVSLDIQVARFHALSEKARYTVGGVHNIIFTMVLRDVRTGEMLTTPREIETDLEAFGGQQAISAESRGLTQKVRISGHLAEVIRQEMTNPEGYKNASLGFFQMINNL